MAFRPPPFWKKNISGIQQPTIEAFGGLGTPNLDKSISAQIGRYSALPTVAQTYGNPTGGKSGWDDFWSGVDKDLLSYALGSVGDFGGQASGGGGGGGGGGAGKIGSKIKPAGFLSPVLEDITPQAPNPGWYLNLPREQKNRYSGGF